jgi:Zn-dependent peptidase ImmA (M78 family)/transcriptional regulator with XRE-family HTH domain
MGHEKRKRVEQELENKGKGRGKHDILPARLLQAREAVGFSLSAAAKKLGFRNYQTLSNIEKGGRKVNANELSAMARLYGRSLDYFFESDISPDPEPLWRKSPDVGAVRLQRRQREFLSFMEKYSDMEKLLRLKQKWMDIQENYTKADFSRWGLGLADQIASDIGRRLDLGSRPAFNLLNVVENSLRIKVLHLELGRGLSGASVVDRKLGVGILINSSEAPWRRNFDLAHELFHIATWNTFTHNEVGDGTVTTKPEAYANAFAANLLLPEGHLRKELQEISTHGKIRIADIIELAKDFGVSTDAVLWRLVNLNVLKKSKVNDVIKGTKLRMMDRAMRQDLSRLDNPTKFPRKYISLACRCLIEGLISRGVFAEYVGIYRADVDNYLMEQGFEEESYERVASA